MRKKKSENVISVSPGGDASRNLELPGEGTLVPAATDDLQRGAFVDASAPPAGPLCWSPDSNWLGKRATPNWTTPDSPGLHLPGEATPFLAAMNDYCGGTVIAAGTLELGIAPEDRSVLLTLLEIGDIAGARGRRTVRRRAALLWVRRVFGARLSLRRAGRPGAYRLKRTTIKVRLPAPIDVKPTGRK